MKTTILFLVTIFLMGCSNPFAPDYIYPGDPNYEEFCSIYIAKQETLEEIATAARQKITNEQVKRCRPPKIIQIDFGGGSNG